MTSSPIRRRAPTVASDKIGTEVRIAPVTDVLASWSKKCISVAPFGTGGWWSFNPCVHHDSWTDRWRVVFRIANYSLPDGIPQLSSEARRGRAQTRNVVGDLDPETIEITSLHEIAELDDRPRASSCTSLGYEDVRMFRTARDGLCAVATSLQLNLEHPSRPEIALLRFNDDLDIVDARPLRGPWSGMPQKNWVPFDGADEVRLLYSIERGVVIDGTCQTSGPSLWGPRGASAIADLAQRPVTPPRQVGSRRCGVEVRLTSPMRIVGPPTLTTPRPGSSELRGGSQLVEIQPGRWIGIAHEMKLRQPDRAKLYWHTLYAVDASGVLIERSDPFKLDPGRGIEFAAGIAVDQRGGVAISYGTDDHDSWIGVTDLDSIERALRPVANAGKEKP